MGKYKKKDFRRIFRSKRLVDLTPEERQRQIASRLKVMHFNPHIPHVPHSTKELLDFLSELIQSKRLYRQPGNPIVECNMFPKHRKCHGIINFRSPQEATLVLQQLNSVDFKGSPLEFQRANTYASVPDELKVEAVPDELKEEAEQIDEVNPYSDMSTMEEITPKKKKGSARKKKGSARKKGSGGMMSEPGMNMGPTGMRMNMGWSGGMGINEWQPGGMEMDMGQAGINMRMHSPMLYRNAGQHVPGMNMNVGQSMNMNDWQHMNMNDGQRMNMNVGQQMNMNSAQGRPGVFEQGGPETTGPRGQYMDMGQGVSGRNKNYMDTNRHASQGDSGFNMGRRPPYGREMGFAASRTGFDEPSSMNRMNYYDYDNY